MCVPGPVTSYTSQGVNNWLRQGRGTVVTQGAEVLELIGQSGEHLVEPPRGEERPRDAAQPDRAAGAGVGAGQRAGQRRLDRTTGAGLHVRATEAALRRLEAQAASSARVEGGWRLAA